MCRLVRIADLFLVVFLVCVALATVAQVRHNAAAHAATTSVLAWLAAATPR